MPDLRAYACGATSHDLARLVRGAPRGRREYPAGAFLFVDGDRRVLFDTGYAPRPWRAGAAAWLYRRLLPPRIGHDETVDARLRADGIPPESITHVVLSHLHPDHIGGIRFFSHATFVLSAAADRALRAPGLREGIFPGLVPAWFADADRLVIDDLSLDGEGFDLFGDGTYRIVDLPGHARGHLGALIAHRVLLAGDAAWSRDLLGREAQIRAVPRAVAHDFAQLTATAQRLQEAEHAGIRLVFSHDRHPARIELT